MESVECSQWWERLYCENSGDVIKRVHFGVAQTFALSLYRSNIVKGIVDVCIANSFLSLSVVMI